MLHDIPPAHLAIALLLLAAMLGAAMWGAVRARRRPKPRGIRVDIVAASGGQEGRNRA